MKSARVLIADDDPDLRRLVARTLSRAEHEVSAAADGTEALELFFEVRPDLVVLDVNMPGHDGWTVLTRIRESSDVPVIMLTARTSEIDTVRALRAGADDYLTKPFRPSELVARIEAILRRVVATDVETDYEDAVLHIDFPARRVRVDGADVSLSPIEFRLLATLVRNAGTVLGTDRLRELVWDDTTGIARDQVKLYIGYLRRKLREHAPDGWAPIENVRGQGYRYDAPAEHP